MVRPDPSRDGISWADVGIVAEVNDTPEEPIGGDPGPDEGGNTGSEGPESPQRGWIDPDDRLWRHPSEVAGPSAGTPLLLNAPPPHTYRSVVMVLVGVFAVMAVVAWIIVLLSPASQHPLRGDATDDTVADASVSTLAGTQNVVPAAAEAVGHSMVELQATTAHGTVSLVGVAVAEGGVVATTADVLRGVGHVVMVGPDGKPEPASVVAIDQASDIALVNVPVDLPVAPFADDAALDSGTSVLTLSYVPDGARTIALHSTPGLVTGVGTAISAGPAGGMPSITSSAPAPIVNAGQPLVTASGDVVGILYDPDPGTGSAVTFLPSDLVVGVADDLRSRDHVVHGWLGMSGTDAPGDAGAKVETVQAHGPSANRLVPGDIIVAVNAAPIRTMAELRASLYVLAPGTSIALSVQGPSGARTVDVTLSGSP
jgi:S1-C subfamily serine protease